MTRDERYAEIFRQKKVCADAERVLAVLEIRIVELGLELVPAIERRIADELLALQHRMRSLRVVRELVRARLVVTRAELEQLDRHVYGTAKDPS